MNIEPLGSALAVAVVVYLVVVGLLVVALPILSIIRGLRGESALHDQRDELEMWDILLLVLFWPAVATIALIVWLFKPHMKHDAALPIKHR